MNNLISAKSRRSSKVEPLACGDEPYQLLVGEDIDGLLGHGRRGHALHW
jgi:hypothetical protein